MKFSNGVYLPDDETDQVMLNAGEKYQAQKLGAALSLVKNRKVAVDVGAHCGLWTKQLGAEFDRVVCFEPLQRHIECWSKNAPANAELNEVALGDKECGCSVRVIEGASGKSFVDGPGEIPMKTLDSYGLKDVGLLKVDCEGYELMVLKGAEKTLKENKPIVIVEQKKARYGIPRGTAVEYLKSLGAVVYAEMIGDYIMGWDSVVA